MVEIADIINWVKGIDKVTIIIILCCCLTFLIIKYFIKRWGVQIRQMPDLNVIEKDTFYDGVHHKTKKFETGGMEFDTKPEAYNHAKKISKRIL